MQRQLSTKANFFSDDSRSVSTDSKAYKKVSAELQKLFDQEPTLQKCANALQLHSATKCKNLEKDSPNMTLEELKKMKDEVDAELQNIDAAEMASSVLVVFATEIEEEYFMYLNNTRLAVEDACEALVPVLVDCWKEVSNKLEVIMKDKQSKKTQDSPSEISELIKQRI